MFSYNSIYGYNILNIHPRKDKPPVQGLGSFLRPSAQRAPLSTVGSRWRAPPEPLGTALP